MILVTGSTGLLGGHVLYELLRKEERVAALKRPSSKTDTLREILSCYTKEPDLLMERIDWRDGDMMDQESLIRALEGISCVVNCAATVSFNPRDRDRLITNNVLGTRNLAAALARKGEERTLLIHVSSTSALGDGPGDDPEFLIDEDTPRDINLAHTVYSVSKHESEQVLREWGTRAVILNPGIILGPGQWGKGSSQLFVKAWQGLKYYTYGGTGYVDVRDVAGIIFQISSRSSVAGHQQRYCLVGANLRYREFFNRVTDEFGKPNPHIYAGKFLAGFAWRADTFLARLAGRPPLLTRETAASAQRISYYSSEKIRKELSFEFRPVEATIEWVAGCYRKMMEFPVS